MVAGVGFHERELLDLLGQIEPVEYNGRFWSTTWKGRDPLIGGTGGGRWSRANGVEMLYTSLDGDTSLSELYFHLSNAPISSSCAMELCGIQVSQLSLLDLTAGSTLRSLNIRGNTNSPEELETCQNVGAAAAFLEHHGILVPSFRAGGNNGILFLENFPVEQHLQVAECQDINWPAWKQSRSKLS